MTVAYKLPVTCTCPSCETEWIQDDDGNWGCDPFFGRFGYDRYHRDPLEDGRKFCPVCAFKTSSVQDRIAFIRQDGHERAFFRWLLSSDADAEDMFKILTVDTQEDREAWMDIRTDEFIQDCRYGEFVEWRCGD